MEYKLNVGIYEYSASASLLTLNDKNIEESYKQDIVANIEFEAIENSIQTYLCYQCMVDFVNKLELSDQKYQTNGNLRDENYNGKLLFFMKDFVSIGTDCQSMYFMSTSS